MAPPPRGGAVFRPRFTLTILYFAGFFSLLCGSLALPALIEVAREVPPGPEQEAAALEAARSALAGRLWIAILAALAMTAIGSYARLLPGLRDS